MKKVIGLTGGIAQGKTAVSTILQEFGIRIIDADEVSRRVQESGTPCSIAMQRQFPSCYKNGDLDRRALRELVFANDGERERLNRIVLPFILEEIDRLLSQENGFVVLVAPLLFESGLDAVCDVVVTVTCSDELRIKRLMARDTIDSSLARSMIESQMSDAERTSRADFVLYNDGTREELSASVNELFARLQSEGLSRKESY